MRRDMVKYAGLFTALFLFSGVATLTAVTFRGRMMNGSKDSSAVSGLNVELLKFDPSTRMPEPIDKQITSEQGKFRFFIPGTETDSRYFASSGYQGARYFSEPLQADSINTLVVYDSTHSVDALQTVMHHVFIEQGEGALLVRENRIIENRGNRSVINAYPDTEAGVATFVFTLPQSNFNFKPSENNDAKMVAMSNRVYDMGIFLPGARQISYSYFVPWNGKNKTLILNPGLTTSDYDVFINNPDLRVSSNQLQFMGDFTIRGRRYLRLQGEELQKESRIVLRIETDDSGVPVYVLISIFSLVLTGGYLLSRNLKLKPEIAQHPDAIVLDNRKKKLLDELNRLDPKSEKFHHLFQQLENVEILSRLYRKK